MNRLSNPELTILRKSLRPPCNRRRNMPSRRCGSASAPIARHHPSFVELYYAIEARRTSAMPLVVQFISPTPGAGASTVASGYARVAADDCAQPVLYIDCNAPPPKPRRGMAEPLPLTLFDALRRGLPLSDAITPCSGCQEPAVGSSGTWRASAVGAGRRPVAIDAGHAAGNLSRHRAGYAADRSAGIRGGVALLRRVRAGGGRRPHQAMGNRERQGACWSASAVKRSVRFSTANRV